MQRPLFAVAELMSAIEGRACRASTRTLQLHIRGPVSMPQLLSSCAAGRAGRVPGICYLGRVPGQFVRSAPDNCAGPAMAPASCQ